MVLRDHFGIFGGRQLHVFCSEQKEVEITAALMLIKEMITVVVQVEKLPNSKSYKFDIGSH